MKSQSFLELVEKTKRVKEIFGSMNGTKLKELIYELFDEEIKQKKLDEVI